MEDETEVKSPQSEEDDPEENRMKQGTRDEDQEEDKDKKKRPSLRQLNKLRKIMKPKGGIKGGVKGGIKGPTGAGGAGAGSAGGAGGMGALGGGAGAGGAAGAGAAGGAGAIGGGAAAGGAAAGGAAAAGGTAAAGISAGGVVLIVIGVVLLLILLVIILMGGPADADPRPKLTITKSGPTEARINDELPYQINVSYPAQAVDIVITDRLPDGTEYISSDQKTTCENGECNSASRVVNWSLKDFVPLQNNTLSNINTTFTLRLRATQNDLVLVNQAEGTVTPFTPPVGGGGGPVTGDIVKLLPNPLPPDVEGTQGEKTAALDAVSANRAVYERVAAATGVPWQVFAGIHYREGGAGPTKSIVSGREIGANEPDVVDGPGCSASAPIGAEDGMPEVSGNFCVFSSLVDSGIYSGTLLKQKVDGNLNTFEDLVKAMSYYNGGGNSNCDKTPYTGCPRQFIGEDDTYVMNLFDNRHVPMYIVYCADYTKCNPPVEDGRPGTATVTKWAAQGIK